eukprot:6090512-Amphidinium_carterae.2
MDRDSRALLGRVALSELSRNWMRASQQVRIRLHSLGTGQAPNTHNVGPYSRGTSTLRDLGLDLSSRSSQALR